MVGDTRFDRVLQIREEAKHLPLVELFKNNTMTFVAGSSWQPDEDLFIEYFNQHPEVKLGYRSARYRRKPSGRDYP